ncbi:MAG: peptidoglycan editing factor PgeF [Eubacteriales bacterium]
MQSTQKNGVLFYHSPLIPVPHGFSTRIGGVSTGDQSSLNMIPNHPDTIEHVAENFRRFASATSCPNNSFARNRQIHSDIIHRVETALTLTDLLSPTTAHLEGDGLLTDKPQISLLAYSGDCVPILFYDKRNHIISAVHSGWRGTALGIAGKMITTMTEQFSSHPQDIVVAIGPAIRACCFSCHDDVPTAMRQTLGNQADPHITKQGEKFSVDLIGINRLWLENAGVSPQNIDSDPPCTACNPDQFWSHRNMGNNRGSMVAIISLPEGGHP